MLGLGDIVFPGFLIALLLRFDLARAKQHKQTHATPVYFITGLLSYAAALFATGIVLHVFKAAQVCFNTNQREGK
jgi:minor histocompatibility antigen H13